jgi:hypothetical protein
VTGWLIVSFFGGAVGHKFWRAGWRAWAHKVKLPHALVDEFHPPSPERDAKPKKRLKPTEIA